MSARRHVSEVANLQRMTIDGSTLPESFNSPKASGSKGGFNVLYLHIFGT